MAPITLGAILWALMIHGIPPSLKVGLIAGVIGTAVGVVLGITAGYYGGTNLLPYVMAGFVGAVSGAILSLVGIQILGLGPLFTPNLGMILQSAYLGAAIFRGMWWWWVPPTVTLMIIFISLFLISIALDELANPRLRERAK